ncbi:hypothetical protein N7G274_010901 [Stereocaulon virgatum]|uniref:Rhodopsin domain-containing protein n=1 Tax=Stereocaulon virgatum TaxID=373712 RepID=A0ABR3ZSQ3_9LECA
MDPSMITPDTPALMPPPGLVPNFVNPPSHNTTNTILHSICLTLVTLFLAMRLYTRHFISYWLSWDDYICVLTYAFTTVFSGLLLAAQHLGLGRHLWDIRAISIIESDQMLKLLFVSEMVYLPFVAALKCSLLLFFERVVFLSHKIHYCSRLGMLIVVVFHLALFFRSLFLCIPLQKALNPTLPGHCLREDVLPYLSGIFNIVSDFYILFVPLPFLMGLKMAAGRKLRLIAVFSVGLFACAASAVRLGVTIVTVNSLDFTSNFSTLSFWAVLEVNVGIICACSLALPAFVDRYWPRINLSICFGKFSSYVSSNLQGSSSKPSKHSGTGDVRKYVPDTYSSPRELHHNRPSARPEGWTQFVDEEEHRADNIRGDRDPFVNRTMVTGRGSKEEDVETWGGRGGILRTVALTKSYPMTERK